MDERSLADLSLREFLDRVASNTPTPGGGSVAALTGTLAASLGQMACALTMGKPRFADVEHQIQELAARLQRSADMLRRLIDEDAAAYGELSAAFSIQKTDSTRRQRIANAAVLAAEVPLQTAALCHEVLTDLQRLSPIGNPNLRSDVDAGTHLARAALAAAAENVRVNLPLISADAAERIDDQLRGLVSP